MSVALLEGGEELLRYFEFDAQQLTRLINIGVADGQRRVDSEDIEMLAIATSIRTTWPRRWRKGRAPVEAIAAFEALKQYLFRKYQARHHALAAAVGVPS